MANDQYALLVLLVLAVLPKGGFRWYLPQQIGEPLMRRGFM